MWSWFNPVKIVFGEETFSTLEDHLEPFKRILVITGRRFVKESGLVDRFSVLMKNKNWYWYHRVTPEPTWDVVQEAVDFARDFDPDCVVGIGGGSVLDTSKLVASFCKSSLRVRDFIGKRVDLKRDIFSICVPTTSGSGSEVTPYCVVIDREKKIKSPITSYANYPDLAIDDPELTYGTPYDITRNAGIDALSHCIEAYLSKRASSMTSLFCIEGIRLIFRHLKNALEDDHVARSKLMLASLYGGLGISNAGAGLIHQLGHALTVLRGFSHGYTMGIFMVPVLEFYGDSIREKLFELEKGLGIKYFIGFLYRFLKDLGIPDIKEIGLKESEIDDIVSIVMRRKHIIEILPKRVDEDTLREFLLNESKGM